MSFFHRGKREVQLSDTNPVILNKQGPGHHRNRARSGAEWQTAKYRKLTEDQRESLDRILHFLERQTQYTT